MVCYTGSYDTKVPCKYLYYLLYIDINECTEGIHQCQQTCQNMIGSYTCGCSDGFMLGNDRRSCSGKTLLSIITIICIEL
jgi:hypothetical protein